MNIYKRLNAMRSFTEPPALKNSHFATEKMNSSRQIPNTSMSIQYVYMLTQIALETLLMRQSIATDKRCVSDMVEDGVEHWRFRMA
jgi:hypothetical protein